MSKRISRSPPFFPTSCEHKLLGPCFISLFFSSPQSSRHVSGFFFSFLFLFSFFFFLFSFLFTTTGLEMHLGPFFFLFFFFYHFILLTTNTGLFFQILKLQHPDDVNGTRKGSRCVSSPLCLFFFLQSNFFY